MRAVRLGSFDFMFEVSIQSRVAGVSGERVASRGGAEQGKKARRTLGGRPSPSGCRLLTANEKRGLRMRCGSVWQLDQKRLADRAAAPFRSSGTDGTSNSDA